MRILIAEDDSILADGLTRSLRLNGYAVDAVSDGLAADSALRSQEFDLLILDLGLPRMSGLEVLSNLRSKKLALACADSDGRGQRRAACQRTRPRRGRLHGQTLLSFRT